MTPATEKGYAYREGMTVPFALESGDRLISAHGLRPTWWTTTVNETNPDAPRAAPLDMKQYAETLHAQDCSLDDQWKDHTRLWRSSGGS